MVRARAFPPFPLGDRDVAQGRSPLFWHMGGLLTERSTAASAAVAAQRPLHTPLSLLARPVLWAPLSHLHTCTFFPLWPSSPSNSASLYSIPHFFRVARSSPSPSIFPGSELDFQSCVPRLGPLDSSPFVLEAHPHSPSRPLCFPALEFVVTTLATLDLRTRQIPFLVAHLHPTPDEADRAARILRPAIAIS